VVGVVMPYLICDKCNVYYEIEDEEEIFEFCECGNRLKYYESLEEYYEEIESEEPIRETIRLRRSYTEIRSREYTLIEILGAVMSIIGIIGLIMGSAIGMLFLIGILTFTYAKSKGYSWKKGLEGEKIVSHYLETLPQGYIVFNDVKLPGSRGNIDHVVIGPTGILVIETKNYEGEYIIKGNEWYLKKGPTLNPKKEKRITKKPGKQAKANALILRDFLSDNIDMRPWVHAIVALTSQKPHKVLTEHYSVLQPEEIPEFIMSKKGRFTEDSIEKATELLSQYSAEVSFM